MKKIREFHYNEGENISGESIGVVALIRGRRLIEGGAYSSKYGIRGRPLFEGGANLKIVPDNFTFSMSLFKGALSIC